MTGYSIALIPASWKLGRFRKAHKTLLAVGPLRFIVHRGLTPDIGD